MYYVLECFGPRDAERAGVEAVINTDVNWETGSRFDESPPVPVRVELDRDSGVLVPMFDEGVLLISDDMLTSLRNAGVDNLEVYQAELIDPVSGTVHRNYKAVNVIGVIAAADLGRSRFHTFSGSPVIDVSFDSLVIDEAKAGDRLMFRLAECISALIIHHRVKEQLEHDGIPNLDFTEPMDFVS